MDIDVNLPIKEAKTRRIQHAVVLADVKAEPFGGRCATSLDIVCARRSRSHAVGAGESLRRGRTKEMTPSRTTVLASSTAIAERKKKASATGGP